MKPPYICPMGVHQDVNEPCPKCGATEDTDEGCLGMRDKIEREVAEAKARAVHAIDTAETK